MLKLILPDGTPEGGLGLKKCILITCIFATGLSIYPSKDFYQINQIIKNYV